MRQCPKCLKWYLNRQSSCDDCDESLLANEVSSEDGDDGVFQHRDTEAQRKQRDHDEATAVPKV